MFCDRRVFRFSFDGWRYFWFRWHAWQVLAGWIVDQIGEWFMRFVAFIAIVGGGFMFFVIVFNLFLVLIGIIGKAWRGE